MNSKENPRLWLGNLYFLTKKENLSKITPPYLLFAEFCLFDERDDGPKPFPPFIRWQMLKRQIISSCHMQTSCCVSPHIHIYTQTLSAIRWLTGGFATTKPLQHPSQSVHTSAQMLDISLSAFICMTTLMLTFFLTKHMWYLFDTKYNEPVNRCPANLKL